MTMRSPVRVAWCGMAVAALTMAGGCATESSADKAGGQGESEPVTLDLALSVAATPEFVAFADDVADRSGGTIEVELRPGWAPGDPTFEASIVADVRAGTVDMASLGVRVFDQLGVTDFQALLAPMLIDGQELQEAVFDAGIPTSMMAGLGKLSLVGLAVLPGPMRKVMGVERALVGPADFDGAIVGTQDSGVAERTMAALGATARRLPAGAELVGLDAYDQQFGSIAGNQYWRSARFVTANLNLWPRPLVVVVNGDVFEALSPLQQGALRDAAAATAAGAGARAREEDRAGAAEACRHGMTFAVADADDLDRLRAAVEPVYDELTADATTARYLSEIASIKERLATPPDTAGCDATVQGTADAAVSAPAAGATSPLDGVYAVTTTAADLVRAGDRRPIPENWGEWVFVFDRGRFAFSQENAQACTWAYGTYEISGHRLALAILDGGAAAAPNSAWNRPGERFVFEWAQRGDELALSPVPGEISPENFLAVPWRRLSTAPATDGFSQRCPPPSSAFTTVDQARIPDGRYSRVATVADAVRLGLDVDAVRRALAPDGSLPITFEIDGDRWTQLITSDAGAVAVGDSGSASYDDNGRWVTISDSPGCQGCVLTFEWTLEDGSLTLTLIPTEFYDFHDDEQFMTDGVYEQDIGGGR